MYALAIIAVIVALVTSSCVTASDLRQVASSIEAMAGDVEGLEESARKAKEEIDGVAERVDGRTENFLDGMSTTEIGVLLTSLMGLTGLGVDKVRDRRRKRRNEDVS